MNIPEQLLHKAAFQREARNLAASIAPHVPFPFLVTEMKTPTKIINGKKYVKNGSTFYRPEYFDHPEIENLRKSIKVGWAHN